MFLSTSTMMDAETQLIERGVEAIPVLISLLSGEAKNNFGVPYRELGLPLRCALEVACRLGPIAKPLEGYLCEAVRGGNATAATALGSLGTLEKDSVVVLGAALDSDDYNLSAEAAAALIKAEATRHPAILEVTSRSIIAANMLEKISAYITANRIKLEGIDTNV